MRALIKSTLWVVGILLVYFLYTLYLSGYFRTIVPAFDGRTLQTVALKGAEDIAISRSDSFAIVSSTDRRGLPDPPQEPGGLYLIDLREGDFIPQPLTAAFDQPFAPHGISVFRQDSSHQVMAINHAGGRHTIEVFELKGQALGHVRTLVNPSLVSPNDLVIVGKDRFYFTNDHGYRGGAGKMVEDFVGLPLSTVVYHDSAGYREVAGGIAYANGIAYDHQRGLLYVASLRHFLVKVYAIQPDGSLSFVEDIPCGTGVDNIELDEEGHLWIGAHPNLLGFISYAGGKKAVSPSEIIRVVYRGPGDYSVHQVYLGDGSEMSGSSVAVPWGRLILAGNVMDDKFLVLERDAGPATR